MLTELEYRQHCARTPELSVRLGFHPLEVKFSETHSYDEATGVKMAEQYVAITCIIANIAEYLFLNGRPRRILESWEADLDHCVATLQPFFPPRYAIGKFLTTGQRDTITIAEEQLKRAHGA